jgi:rhamnulokinase
MNSPTYLAFDLGAESGRAIAGRIEHGLLHMEEIHRFPNAPQRLLGHLHWNIFRLFEELKTGLVAARSRFSLRSIGIDTWGVDFALLGSDGRFLGLPFAYRDVMTDGMLDHLFTRIPREELYRLTGIQFLQFNSIVQLLALREQRVTALEAARHLLFIPDALNYLFSGVRANEFTIASTSQLLNPHNGTWCAEVFDAIGIDPLLMEDIVAPGNVLGTLLPEVAVECGTTRLDVVAVTSHDTAAAVAAVPATGNRWAYISSGTWSLLGVEIPRPILTPAALAANFTNEGGLGQTVRFLKNIMGLWPLQECRRIWGGRHTYPELMQAAENVPPFRSLMLMDDPRFLHPTDMPAAIRTFCTETKQPVPDSEGAFVRCILESLALAYRAALDQLEAITGDPLEVLHIIGGGSRNRLLCQFAADATGLRVVAGPAEGTAMGNLLVQAMADQALSSHAECREVVRRSSELVDYLPADTEGWEKHYQRYVRLRQQLLQDQS